MSLMVDKGTQGDAKRLLNGRKVNEYKGRRVFYSDNPRRGRSSYNAQLQDTKIFDSLDRPYRDADIVEDAIEIMKQDRERINEQSADVTQEQIEQGTVGKVYDSKLDVMKRLGALRDDSKHPGAQTLTVDRNSSRIGAPYRIQFHGDVQLINFDGEEIYVVHRGRDHEDFDDIGDVKRSGYDEAQVRFQELLGTGWPVNYFDISGFEDGNLYTPDGKIYPILPNGNRLVNVGTSLMDPTYHVVIHRRGTNHHPDLTKDTFVTDDRLFIGAYKEIFDRYAKSQGKSGFDGEIVHFRDIESDPSVKLERLVLERDIPGIAIVNSGESLYGIDKDGIKEGIGGIVICREPPEKIMQSTTVEFSELERLQDDPLLRKFASTFKTLGPENPLRIDKNEGYLRVAYDTLMGNTKNLWESGRPRFNFMLNGDKAHYSEVGK